LKISMILKFCELKTFIKKISFSFSIIHNSRIFPIILRACKFDPLNMGDYSSLLASTVLFCITRDE
jgi:hypothetical protein